HIQDRGYANCLGFLRPKGSTKTIPRWLETILREQGLSFDEEGAFREFWGKALKYDEDVKSLQEQVKSANEALADRAMEVSVLIEKNQKLSDKVAEVEEILNIIRNEKDALVAEKARLKVELERVASENKALAKQIGEFSSQNPLHGYSWWARLISLFKKPPSKN
ncbi:MAG: hypothetical protein N2558_00940, partial [Patescibacteria group bacterium]|nr:hypothetical protein [Patescibacteria group bacterium]